MEKSEKIDFYSYGYKKGLTDDNIKSIKREITIKYGEEAAFEFLAGFITAQEDAYIKNKDDNYEPRSGGPTRDEEYVDVEMIDGASGVVHDPYVRNNSFYGGTGISPIYNSYGTFNKPPVNGKDKSR